MKVRFTAAFDYVPSRERRVTFAYKPGWSGTVKRECGEAAIAAGKAVELKEETPAPEVSADDEATQT